MANILRNELEFFFTLPKLRNTKPRIPCQLINNPTNHPFLREYIRVLPMEAYFSDREDHWEMAKTMLILKLFCQSFRPNRAKLMAK